MTTVDDTKLIRTVCPAHCGIDACGILATMLQRMQAEIRQVRRLGSAEHTKYPALIMKMIVFQDHHGALHSAAPPERPSPLVDPHLRCARTPWSECRGY